MITTICPLRVVHPTLAVEQKPHAATTHRCVRHGPRFPTTTSKNTTGHIRESALHQDTPDSPHEPQAADDEPTDEPQAAAEAEEQLTNNKGILTRLQEKHFAAAQRPVQRLHRNLGHPTNLELARILKEKDASASIIAAAHSNTHAQIVMQTGHHLKYQRAVCEQAAASTHAYKQTEHSTVLTPGQWPQILRKHLPAAPSTQTWPKQNS